MAGDWIKMECCTPDKPEVLALSVRMGWDDPDLAVGKLFKLWRWFDQHTVDGNAHGVTPALLDRYFGVSGFVSAVTHVGWLTVTEDGISLPNFDAHNGASAKKRCSTAKRVANFKSNAKGNGSSVTESVSDALPREEKRREENSNSVAKATGDKSPLTPDEIIFGYGLPLLTNAGTPDKQARSFLGGLRKQHGDEVLVNTLRDCIKAKPLQPLEWLAAALPPKGTLKRNKQEQVEDENHAIVRRLLEKEAAHAAI